MSTLLMDASLARQAVRHFGLDAQLQILQEELAEAIVAKNRHGETSVVRLGWDGAHTRFSNLDVTHEF